MPQPSPYAVYFCLPIMADDDEAAERMAAELLDIWNTTVHPDTPAMLYAVGDGEPLNG